MFRLSGPVGQAGQFVWAFKESNIKDSISNNANAENLIWQQESPEVNGNDLKIDVFIEHDLKSETKTTPHPPSEPQPAG
jgi:hypothetical protein